MKPEHLKSLIIRPEQDSDSVSIFHVHQAAFGQPAEAQLVEQLRSGGHQRVSVVAELNGEIVGHVVLSDLKIVTVESEEFAALSLAPVGVLPDYQRQGIGAALIEQSLKEARQLNAIAVIVLGHPEYYSRFGFCSELAKVLECPFPGAGDAWMALELSSDSLKNIRGQVRYTPPFGIFDSPESVDE